MTYILLGKNSREAPANFNPISLLPKALECYSELIKQFKEVGVKHLQIDEPILILDSAKDFSKEFKLAYDTLAKVASGIEITLATCAFVQCRFLSCLIPNFRL